jgi:phosphoribosylglycinamide formyltransferase-1
MDNKKYRIALFASGSGSNAEKITHYFTNHPSVEVGLMLCNKKEAGVFDRMSTFPQVVSRYLNNKDFRDGETVLEILSEHHIDFIVLAGFLLKIPENLIKAYPKRIINIHPALLPKYGGKGMYGHFVHEAVIENDEKESGITIHEVNEAYDEGAIIFQASCQITAEMNAEELAAKIQQLEHQHFPKVIEEYILNFREHL